MRKKISKYSNLRENEKKMKKLINKFTWKSANNSKN